MSSVSVNVSRDLTGWGRGTWSSGAWSRSFTGSLDITGSIGSADATSPDISFFVLGVQGDTGIGDVSVVIGNQLIQVTGVGGTSQVGKVLVWGLVNTDQVPNWKIIEEAA